MKLSARVVALTLLLPVTASCSFTWTRGPAPGRERCSTSYAPPIADTVIGLPILALGIAGSATARHSQNAVVPEGPINATAILVGALYGFSAVHGYGAVHRCRAARR